MHPLHWDTWRAYLIQGAKVQKNRGLGQETMGSLAMMLSDKLFNIDI